MVERRKKKDGAGLPGGVLKKERVRWDGTNDISYESGWSLRWGFGLGLIFATEGKREGVIGVGVGARLRVSARPWEYAWGPKGAWVDAERGNRGGQRSRGRGKGGRCG
jgi:hypothetical protein